MTRRPKSAEGEIDLELNDGGSLNASIMERIERISAEEMPDSGRVAELMRAQSQRELETRSAEWTGFQARVMERIAQAAAEETEREFQPIAMALRAASHAELERREGDWTAFGAQLKRAVGEMATREERLDLEERAIGAAREQIRAELEVVEGRFGHAFLAQVEDRLNDKAAPPAVAESSWRASVRAAFAAIAAALHKVFGEAGPRWAIGGLAGALACVLLALVAPMTLDDGVPNDDEPVQIDDLSFEGTATVMSRDGVAVIWLADGQDDDNL